MPKTRPPYPAEFRRQMIDLVRAGRDPADLAREFEPSAQATRNWVAEADRQEGRREAAQPAALTAVVSVKVVEIAGGLEVAIDQAAWGGTSDGGLGVASPSINGGTSSAMASTCM
jgi:transposase-like protein